MKPIARKHHYLPQAYLAAFTETKSKDGQFYVFDTLGGTHFRTSPINVAAERDFNRVDIEGKPLDVLEQALSPFEDRAVQAIRNVNRTEIFPNDEDHSYILNLLSLIAVRNPRLRKSFNRSCEALVHVIGDLLVSDENIFSQNLKKAREAGHVKETNVSYEDVKRFIEERRYQIEFAPEDNLRVEFHAHDKLLPILGQRSWSLLVAPDSGPYFICSDHPVALTWKSSERNGPIGYGLKGTEVFFPLGPRTGFYGVYEESLSTVVTLTPAQVALMNVRVVQNAERHVFTTKDTFFLWYKGALKEVNLGLSKE